MGRVHKPRLNLSSFFCGNYARSVTNVCLNLPTWARILGHMGTEFRNLRLKWEASCPILLPQAVLSHTLDRGIK